MVKENKLELVTSYVLYYENSNNRSLQKKQTIESYMKDYTSFYVDIRNEAMLADSVAKIMRTGIKEKDAYHVACAKLAECAYFITTDDRLLKYRDDNIIIVTPGEFIRRIEEKNNV